MSSPTPDFFDSLACVSRFAYLHDSDPDFYARHKTAIDKAISPVLSLARLEPSFQIIMSFTLAPIAMTAQGMRDWFHSARDRIDEPTINLLDKLMDEAMRTLHPVLADPALPKDLEQCRWGIEAAYVPRASS
jgi:hypothetical protein